MTYPQTADLERELAPTVVAEIMAVRARPYPRERGGVPLPVAIRVVAEAWWRDAISSGLSAGAAEAVERFVYRVGAELLSSPG